MPWPCLQPSPKYNSRNRIFTQSRCRGLTFSYWCSAEVLRLTLVHLCFLPLQREIHGESNWNWIGRWRGLIMLWIFFVKPPHLNGIYQTKAWLKELATQRLLACKCTTSGLRIRINLITNWDRIFMRELSFSWAFLTLWSRIHLHHPLKDSNYCAQPTYHGKKLFVSGLIQLLVLLPLLQWGFGILTLHLSKISLNNIP